MAADECSIRVVARFRPLNESEERAGSKSVVRFPADQEETVLISVSYYFFDHNAFLPVNSFYREKSMYLIKYFVQMPRKKKSTMKQRKKSSKMFSVVTMELFSPMVKHPVEKRIPWR